MNKEVFYKYPHGREYVAEHIDATICLRKDQLVESIQCFKARKGNAINDYMVCFFRKEFDDELANQYKDAEVAVIYDDSFKDITHIVLLQESDFFLLLKEKIPGFKTIFSTEEFERIQKSLEEL